MTRLTTGLIRLRGCSREGVALSCYLLVAACAGEPQRVVTHLPTPPERLVCEGVPNARPSLPAQYRIDWSSVTTLAQARAEHERYVRVEVERNGIVAGYLLNIEGRLFLCFNNMQWRREYEAGIAAQGD